jgi:uncharacterized membrane protein YedE/YeeE
MITDYIVPLSGGLAIGLAATILLLCNGRVAGISGILWGAVSRQHDQRWRWLFVLGLLVGPVVFHFLSGVPAPAPSQAPWWLIIIAGLIVGYGVRMGCGCTSGHGVCGIGRLSLRSLVATLTFMSTGILTVYLLRHVLGASL